jgi:energy-coupling factor transporter transmembrane protein EcfT
LAGDRASWAAPLLLGSMVGGLLAGRLEMGALCVLVAVVVCALVGAGRPARSILVTLVVGFALAIGFNLFLIPGAPLWRGPLGLTATTAGLERGVLLGLRLTAAGLAVHGLRAVWPGERAADEIAGWLAPLERLRIPVHASRTIVGLAIRFVPMLARESRRIADLQALRAGRRPRGLAERLEQKRATLVPTLVAALERADRVSLALEARHYRARPVARRPGSWRWRVVGLALAGTALLWRS